MYDLHSSSLSACTCPHKQLHTLLSLLDNWVTLSNSYPNTCLQCREAVCTIFMMVFGMTWPGRESANYRMGGEHWNVTLAGDMTSHYLTSYIHTGKLPICFLYIVHVPITSTRLNTTSFSFKGLRF